MAKKKKRQQGPSARQLFEHVTYQLEELQRRYAILFEIASTPGAWNPPQLSDHFEQVTLDCDMKAGQKVLFRVPQKFVVSR